MKRQPAPGRADVVVMYLERRANGHAPSATLWSQTGLFSTYLTLERGRSKAERRATSASTSSSGTIRNSEPHSDLPLDDDDDDDPFLPVFSGEPEPDDDEEEEEESPS